MKKIIQLSLLCVLFVTGCKGWKDALVGTLEIYTPFLVKSEPKNIYFDKGNHKDINSCL